ncbi:bile acid:sodium symporter family protein [Chloroflexota bacterium]
MKIAIRLLRNRNFILLLAVALGLAAGQLAHWTQPAVLPVLALVMTLSTASITTHELASLRSMTRPVLTSLVLNYVVCAAVILVTARLLIDDSELWAGFVVLAAVPTAVAVTPFSYILGGNVFYSLIGMVSIYISALIITPLIIVAFLGAGFIEPMKLVMILVQLIVIPLIASRLLRLTGLIHSINKWRGTTVNWSFFLVVFTIVGLNREVFFEEIDVVVKISIIAIAFAFILGHIIEFVASRMHLDRETTISWMMLGTKKNNALASAIALSLFGERASIPATVSVVFAILHVVWLGYYLKRRRPKTTTPGQPESRQQ